MGTPDPDRELREQVLRALGEPLLLAGDDADALAAEVRAAAGPGALIGCLEVLEHLQHFAPLIDALVEAAEAGATVGVSVPNTPYTGLDGRTVWDEGAVEELCSLLPDDNVVLHQIALRGSAILHKGEEGTFATEAPILAGTVPTDVLLAFGPRAGELAGTAVTSAIAAAADL